MTDQTEEHTDDQAKEQGQPLVEHLIELRSRLMRALIVIGFVLGCLLFFTNEIYGFVAEPLLKHLPENTASSMIVTDVPAAFLTPFKLVFFTAVFLSMPFLLYQIWAFVAPALYQNERALALPIFFSSVFLFYLGVAFAYYVVFPLIFEFFLGIAPNMVTVMPDITSHLNLVIKLFFAFGIAFEIPVATVILVIAGVISPEKLVQKRPYVIVACFVAGMLLTPPDPFSQAMLALPLWLLFETGIFFGRFITVRRKRGEDEEPAESTD